MPDYSVNVGDAEIISVSAVIFTSNRPTSFLRLIPMNGPPTPTSLRIKALIRMNVGSFVLRVADADALVDTGLGEGDHPFENSEWGLLADDMARKGIVPEEIDTVIITHLHRDHVGWNMVEENGVRTPFFPNARYYIPRADWDVFTRRAGMAMFAYIAEQVMPLLDLGALEFVEGEHAIGSHITALPTPGHTPGHTSVLVSSAGESAVVLGDAAHVPVQAHHTDWSPRADTNPELSRQNRAELFDRMEKDHSLVVSGHFPVPGFGRLVRVSGRRYWRAL